MYIVILVAIEKQIYGDVGEVASSWKMHVCVKMCVMGMEPRAHY